MAPGSVLARGQLVATAIVLVVAASTAGATVVRTEGPAGAPEAGAADFLPRLPLLDPARELDRVARPGIAPPAVRPQASSLAVRAVETLVAGDPTEASRLAEEDLRIHGDTAPMFELLGVVKLLRGETEAGLALLRKAVLVDPGQSTAWIKIGDVLMRRGDLDAAANALHRATAGRDEPQAHRRLGLIAEMKGDDASAIAHYRKGLADTTTGPAIAEKLALLLVRRGEGREAIAVLAPRVDPADPRHRSAFLTLAGARLVAGDAGNAIGDVRTAIGLGDRSTETAFMLAIAARAAGRIDVAREALEPIADLPAPPPSALLQIAETELAAGNDAAAAAAFERLVARVPDHQAGWRRIAQLHLAKGDVAGGERALRILADLPRPSDATLAFLVDVHKASASWDRAERAAQRRVELYPRNPEAQFGYGTLLAALRRYDEAVAPLLAAARMAPGERRYQRALAFAQLRRGDVAAATIAADAAAALDTATADDWFLLGSLLEGQQRQAEAERLYARAIAAQPDHGPALNNLAMLALAQGRIDAATSLAQRAARAMPDSPAALGTYASALTAARRTKEAMASISRALEIAPADAGLHLQAADVQLRLGNRVAARRHAERVVGLAPDGELARRARAILSANR